MRAIKVLVVVMGIMIIVGTVVLAMKIMERMGSKEEAAPQTENIKLPQGAQIRDIQTHEGQILLRLSFPENSHEELWILNGKKGEVIKKITTL